MRMKLVGMTPVIEGITKDEKKEAYCYQRLHFAGRSIDVDGDYVSQARVDYMRFNNLPPFAIGNLYDVDLSDRGFLRNIELLEEAKPAQPPAEPTKPAQPPAPPK